MTRPMGGPMAAMRTSVKPKDFSKTVGRLLEFTRPFWFQMILVILMAVAATVFSILTPKIMGQITSTVVEGVMNKNIAGVNGTIRSLLLWIALFYAASATLTYLQAFIMVKITQTINSELRLKIAAKIDTLPLSYFDTQPFGDVLSRITNDVDSIGVSLQQSITQVITAVTTVLGILVMMLTISPEMTLISLVSLPVSLFFISRIVRIGQGFFRKRQATLGALNGHIEETLSTHPIIKVYNAEAAQIRKFDALSENLYRQSWMAEFIGGLMMPVITFLGNLSYVAVSVLGGYLVIQNRIRVGDIQAFIQYNRNFNQPINQVANIGTQLQSTVAAAERVFEFLDADDEIPDPIEPTRLEQVDGHVSFEHVAFGYTHDNLFIRDLSFEVKPGQRIAIVGPTGAGKTTLINLLMRFYDVKGGAIRIDGIDLRDLKRSDLRTVFGMVLQDTWLFNGTIEENLRFSHPEASKEALMEASRSAKVDHFVKTLPEGYDLVINEEASNISQGQKQLMTIARAFLANPKILILDEATSSVDTRTEVLIQKAMDRLMANRTSFIIAHRLSTIRGADLILVMNHGSIIEQGTHESLMAQNGFYTTLYNSQFEPEN